MQRYDWNSEDGYMDRYDDGLYVLNSDAQSEITRLRERLEQAERERGERISVAEAAQVICDAWDADTLPVFDPHPMLPPFIAALRVFAAQKGE